MASHSINILSLCSGVGGLDLGLRLALPAARTVCYVEREITASQILAVRIADGCLDDAPVWSNLVTFNGAAWRGLVDGIIGGIPCQPFSYAGKRRGESDERNLWPYAIRIIGEVQPSFIFLENVPGIERYYFHRVRPELRAMGYRLAEGIFSAAEIGAPQVRQRFFALGYAQRKYSQRWRERQQLADAPQERSDEVPQWEWIRNATDDTESDVVHAQGQREQSAELSRSWDGLEPTIISVADASGAGLQEWRSESANDGMEQPTIERSGIPLFPPFPADSDSWTRVLHDMPSLEPAVCRMAARVADRLDISRTDRLRALGNLAVPMQAAFAFANLAVRIR